MVRDDDRFVGHGGYVGAPGCAGAHDDGELWDAEGTHWRGGGVVSLAKEGGERRGGRGTSSLVVEDSPEVLSVREDVGLMREVGAAGVDKVDAWETCGAVCEYYGGEERGEWGG